LLIIDNDLGNKKGQPRKVTPELFASYHKGTSKILNSVKHQAEKNRQKSMKNQGSGCKGGCNYKAQKKV